MREKYILLAFSGYYFYGKRCLDNEFFYALLEFHDICQNVNCLLVFPCFTNLKLHKHWIWICGRQRQLTYLLFIHVFPVQLCWETSRTKGELNEKATRGHHDKNGCIGSRIYEEQTTGDDILKSFIVQKFLLKNKIQILSNIEFEKNACSFFSTFFFG